MRVTKRFILAIVLLGFECGPAPRWQWVSAMDNSGQDGATPVLAYLAQLGDRFDCYFTIEESWSGSEIMNSLASHLVSPSKAGPDDLNQRLLELSASVPSFTFKIDENNGRIVHVIDSRLQRLSPYSMDRVVSRLEFDGGVDDLVRAIARNGVAISPQTGFGVGDPVVERRDWTTVVHINAEGLTVRALLSDFIPLKNYERVMWVATTERRKGAITQVNFKGPLLGAGEHR